MDVWKEHPFVDVEFDDGDDVAFAFDTDIVEFMGLLANLPRPFGFPVPLCTRYTGS